MFEKAKFIEPEQVFQLITESIKNKKPFSMVRLTEAPNLILAQETIFNLEELMNIKYVQKYNAREDTGFEYPNLEARDLLVDSLRIASVVGILPYNDDRIASPEWMKRPLTDKVLSYFDSKPELICDACINREMPSKLGFWKTMSNKRVLVISAWADRFIEVLKSEKFFPFKIKIVGKISMKHYEEKRQVIEMVGKYDFDCIIMTCGVNANIIGPVIAQKYQTVVINLGKSMRFIVENKTAPGMAPFYFGRAKKKDHIFFSKH